MPIDFRRSLIYIMCVHKRRLRRAFAPSFSAFSAAKINSAAFSRPRVHIINVAATRRQTPL